MTRSATAWCSRVLACAVVLGMGRQRSDAALVLVDEGRANAVIVTADKPGPLAKYAVAELNTHLELMCGTRLPVTPESKLSATDSRPQVLVGDCAAAKSAGLVSAELDPERTVVRSSGNRLFLIGGDRGTPTRIPPLGYTALGTLYAVYDMLETDLGLRWLWPGDAGTLVPKQTTVRIGDVDRSFQPPLIQRNIRGGLHDWGNAVAALGMTTRQRGVLSREWNQWARRHRLGRRASFGFGHAYNNWLDKYGHEHPDWFAMMPDGTRVTPEKPYPSLERAKLCVTNPSLLDFIAERGMESLEKNPTVLSFSACPNDSRGYCMCPKCKALDPPEGMPTLMNYPGGNSMYPSLSDRYVWFWNQLAQRLGDRYPDRYIGAYAYSNYNHPPLREKLSKRVIIGYVGFNYLDAAYTEQSRKDWAGWSETGCKLYLRPNLLLVGHGYPLNYARELGRDIKTCFGTGMLGTDFDSMTHQYAAQAPIFYVLTSLLWDPEREVDTVYAEFMDAAYGPAAAAMRRYWDRLEKLTAEIAGRQSGEGGHDTTPNFHEVTPQFYDDALLRELRVMLDDAEAAAEGNAPVRTRVAACRTALEYAEIQRSVVATVKRYGTQADNRDELTALLKRKQAFFRDHLDDWTIGLHHVYWSEWRNTALRRLYGGDLVDEFPQPRELARLVHWQFHTDPEDAGAASGWHKPQHDDSKWDSATCLSFWEQQKWKGYDGTGWYRCRVSVPDAWRKHKRIILRFGAVDESFRLYIDGTMVHESRYDGAVDPDLWKKPRSVDVTQHLRFGTEQALAVEVHDSGGAGGLWKPVVLIHE